MNASAIKSPPKIVYVEDEADLAEAVSTYLNVKGFECRTVLDGGQAMQNLLKDPPDLVLLDVMLPGMDGWELCRQMKSDPVLAKIPVVFVSARTQVTDRIAGLELGAKDYLTKPFSLSELAARLKVHLASDREQAADTWILQGSGLSFLPVVGELRSAGQSLLLTRGEVQVLRTLMLFPDRAFSAEKLAKLLWELECYLTAPEVLKVLEELSLKLRRLEPSHMRLKKEGDSWRWGELPAKAE
jgi:DNA-binding response OmpR family regulator